MIIPTTIWQGLQIGGTVSRTQFNGGPGEILFSGTVTSAPANQKLRFVSGAPATIGRAWQYECSPTVQDPTQ
jgi:hypothetical protein